MAPGKTVLNFQTVHISNHGCHNCCLGFYIIDIHYPAMVLWGGERQRKFYYWNAKLVLSISQT